MVHGRTKPGSPGREGPRGGALVRGFGSDAWHHLHGEGLRLGIIGAVSVLVVTGANVLDAAGGDGAGGSGRPRVADVEPEAAATTSAPTTTTAAPPGQRRPGYVA